MVERTRTSSLRGSASGAPGKRRSCFCFLGALFYRRGQKDVADPRVPPQEVFTLNLGRGFLWTMPAEVKQVRPAVICGAQLEPHILRSPQPFNPSTTFLALRYSLCLCLCLSLSLYLHPSLSPFL